MFIAIAAFALFSSLIASCFVTRMGGLPYTVSARETLEINFSASLETFRADLQRIFAEAAAKMAAERQAAMQAARAAERAATLDTEAAVRADGARRFDEFMAAIPWCSIPISPPACSPVESTAAMH